METGNCEGNGRPRKQAGGGGNLSAHVDSCGKNEADAMRNSLFELIKHPSKLSLSFCFGVFLPRKIASWGFLFLIFCSNKYLTLN
jgi:hypothetical protein